MGMLKSQLVAGTILASMLAYSSSAIAQDAQAPASDVSAAPQAQAGEGEIIVTARRRDETLLSVPVAVTALSRESLDRYATADLSRIGVSIPQASFEKAGGGGSGAIFTIRGIGSSPQDAGIEQSVSIDLDGVQISRGRVGVLSLFDLESVQVLKGPQALFFGKNSPAGVVSVTTAGPTKSWQGYVKAAYEFKADEKIVEGAISGPITDTLGIRVAGRARHMIGWIKNNAIGGPNPFDPTDPLPGPGFDRGPRDRELTGRVTLRWEPTSNFDATLKVFGDRLRSNSESIVETLCDGPFPTAGGIPDMQGDCKLNGQASLGAMPSRRAQSFPDSRGGKPYSYVNAVLSSLAMNYKSDNFSIASTTGYYKYKNLSFNNSDYTRYSIIQALTGDKADSFSQEIRVSTSFDGPINAVIGGYFESNNRTSDVTAQFGPFPLDPATGSAATTARRAINSGKVYSAFGQLIWNLTPEVELAGGARFTRETKKSRQSNSLVNPFNPFPPGALVPVGVVIGGSYADNNVSPEATLTWHPSRNRTLYVAYKTGYKSGGFSNPSILTADFLVPGATEIKPETVKGGEIGAKGEFLDGRLTLTSALFLYKYKDLQLTSFNASTLSFSVRNAGRSETKGFEVEGSFRATDQLTLRGAAGYSRASYTSYATSPCYSGQTAANGCMGGIQDLSGVQLPRAPRWTLSGGFSYDTPLSDAIKLGVSGDVNYRTSYFAAENRTPQSFQDGFPIVSASVRLAKSDDAWELALIGQNLTNEYYQVFTTDKPAGGPGEASTHAARPRQVILQGTVRF